MSKPTRDGTLEQGQHPADLDQQIGNAADEHTIDASGLLDVAWYLQQYPEVAALGLKPSTHYGGLGWKEERRPNPYFDPAWYARTYASELVPQANPLLHYIERGERENAWPSPHFDPEWYRDAQRLGDDDSPLRHFLRHRVDGHVSPLPSFDVQAHLAAHPEIVSQGIDPYLHHLVLSESAQKAARAAASSLSAKAEVPTWATLLAAMSLSPVAEPGQEVVPLEAVMAAVKLLLPWLPFDADWYERVYPDVADAVAEGAFESAQAHFAEHGFFEGRLPRPDVA